MQKEKKLSEIVPCTARVLTRKRPEKKELVDPLDEKKLKKEQREQRQNEEKPISTQREENLKKEVEEATIKVDSDEFINAEGSGDDTGNNTNDGANENANDSDNDNDNDNDDEINDSGRARVIIMEPAEIGANGGARKRVKTKFMRPKIFSSSKDDDAYQWMTRFEKAAKFNGWDQAEILAGLSAYIDRTADRWFRCLNEQQRAESLGKD